MMRALVWVSCTSTGEKASFLAACAPHSGDWLKALPIAACGMRLDDKAVRVGVALRLGLQVCEPHLCPCGSPVDANGSHAFVCKKASGRIARHSAINDIISRAVAAGDYPVTKEPAGLISGRSSGQTGSPLSLGRMTITWLGMSLSPPRWLHPSLGPLLPLVGRPRR